MGLFEKFKNSGTKLVKSYTGAIKGSAIKYSTSEINGVGNGRGEVDTAEPSVVSSLLSPSSKLHNEASTLNTPAVKDILNVNSYTQKYHKTALNPVVPNISEISEGKKAKNVISSRAPRGINATADKIPSFNTMNTYQDQFKEYSSIDKDINSRF